MSEEDGKVALLDVPIRRREPNLPYMIPLNFLSSCARMKAPKILRCSKTAISAHVARGVEDIKHHEQDALDPVPLFSPRGNQYQQRRKPHVSDRSWVVA